MWIMTQNSNRILSTEGLDEIYVSAPAEGKTDYAVMLRKKTDGKPFALGFYQKRERAKEVLKEIYRIQEKHIYFKGGADANTGNFQPAFVAVPPKVFNMPQDDEIFLMEIREGVV